MRPEAVPASLADSLLALVQIPSVIGDEGAIASYVAELGTRAGLRVDRLGNAVVLEPPETAELPRIGLFGHLDTVPGPDDLGRPRIEGDRLIGLGASDMKAGLAVMLERLRERDGYVRHPVCVFYDKEEGPYAENGLGPLLEARPDLSSLDFAVVLEPTDNQIHVGAVGTLHAEVTFRGKRAHSARPWHGENAVHKAGALLTRLHALAPREVEVDGLVFREVLHATIAEGGIARNVLPDRFTLLLNYRFAPGKSLEQAQEDVRVVVAGEAEVRFTDLSPAGKVCAGHPELQRLAGLGGTELLPKQAWTDVARLGALGIDAVNYGPGRTDQAHQQGEWVSLSETARCDAVLRRFLRGESA